MDEAMQESTGALVVAIVEDDPRIQQLLLAEIQDEGHNGVIFNSAEDFLENSSLQPFDLVLLDLVLPGIDGLACLQRIQDKPVLAAPPRVVIVTALNDAGKRAEALATAPKITCSSLIFLSVFQTFSVPHNWANGQQPLKCIEQTRS